MDFLIAEFFSWTEDTLLLLPVHLLSVSLSLILTVSSLLACFSPQQKLLHLKLSPGHTIVSPPPPPVQESRLGDSSVFLQPP